MLFTGLNAWGGAPAWKTDKSEAPARSGPGNHIKSIFSLPSGAKLSLVDGAETIGYTRIAPQSGEQGWVSAHYLSPNPSESRHPESEDKKLSELRSENRKLAGEIESFRSNAKKLEKSEQALSGES